ncbi:MAG: SDR family NAD(P)-dependent oxidoreductase [bacterium]|nr:SDR family NAD(P)-dependent oxidoreductase [bacterium]
MDWKNKTVLVTGAAGFIGSHLTEKLVSLGAKTKAFIRYNSRGNQGFIENFKPQVKEKLEIIAGDLKDLQAVKEASREVDIIFHLGSLIAIPYSYLHPTEVVETNVLGTLNVMNAAKENNVKRIIHTSTSEVYGTAIYVPIDEKHPLQGQSPYSASKIGADMIAESFYRSYDLPVITIRPFNTYGPRQSARAVIPALITQIIAGKDVFLGSTKPVRDFNFVADTVCGFIKTAETSNIEGEVINIGNGKGITIGELTDKIISLIGKEVKVLFDATRIRPTKSEVERLIASNEKAKKLIGWEPKVSLDEGLKRTIDWISDNIAIYKPSKYNV